MQQCIYIFFFKQKTAYEMRISDWSSDVCSSDLKPNWEGHLPRACRERSPLQASPLLHHISNHKSNTSTYACFLLTEIYKFKIRRTLNASIRMGPMLLNPIALHSMQGKNRDRKSTRLNSSH